MFPCLSKLIELSCKLQQINSCSTQFIEYSLISSIPGKTGCCLLQQEKSLKSFILFIHLLFSPPQLNGMRSIPVINIASGGPSRLICSG